MREEELIGPGPACLLTPEKSPGGEVCEAFEPDLAVGCSHAFIMPFHIVPRAFASFVNLARRVLQVLGPPCWLVSVLVAAVVGVSWVSETFWSLHRLD